MVMGSNPVEHDIILMRQQLIVHAQKVQLPLTNVSWYHEGELRIPGTSIVERVFVLHAETQGLKQYFGVLRRLRQHNVLCAKAFSEYGESSFMAVEPFDCSLREYFCTQASKLVNLEGGHDEVHRIFQKLMWQIFEGLRSIHAKGFFHGNLTLGSACVVDASTPNPQIKLAGMDCIERQNQLNGKRLDDLRAFGRLIKGGLEILNVEEAAWKDLVHKLENDEIDSDFRYWEHPAFWRIGNEVAFLGVAVGVLRRRGHCNLHDIVNAKVQEAFEHKDPLVQILGNNVEDSLSELYDKPWKIYVCLRDALVHLDNGNFSSDILDKIGRDERAILHFFKSKYRNIIIDIWNILQTHEHEDFIRAVAVCQF